MQLLGAFVVSSSLGSARAGWHDGVAMVQQQHIIHTDLDDQPPPGVDPDLYPLPKGVLHRWPEYDEGLRMWTRSFFSLLRTRGDADQMDCCALARRTGLVPWETWGSSTPDEQSWWEARNCNYAVGAEEPDLVVGIPLCGEPTPLSAMLPEPLPLPLDFHREDAEGVGREGPGCTPDDRRQLNSSFMDFSKQLIMSDQCQEFYLIRHGVKWDSMTDCIRNMHEVSSGCSSCFTEFLRQLGGTNVESNPGCIDTCMPLGACRVLSDCGAWLTNCTKCAAPALQEHARCLGGPVYNRLDAENVLSRMVIYRSEK